MTRGAGLQGFNLPLLLGLVSKLNLRRFRGLLPRKIRDFILRTQLHFRMAMALQAERHAERLGVINFVHLVNASVTFHAADAAIDVYRVVEICKIRQLVDLDPLNRFARRSAFANQRQPRIILQHLAVAVHAGGRRRDIREP